MTNLASYNIDFNQDFDTGSDFLPLPEGTYGAKITKSEIKETKAGDGSYVNFELTLLGGKGVKGRKVFQMHMLTHPKPIVVNIGLGKLKELATALGLDYDNINDTADFHNKVVGVDLKIELNEEYGDKNIVKKYVEFDESILTDSSTSDSVF